MLEVPALPSVLDDIVAGPLAATRLRELFGDLAAGIRRSRDRVATS